MFECDIIMSTQYACRYIFASNSNIADLTSCFNMRSQSTDVKTDRRTNGRHARSKSATR